MRRHQFCCLPANYFKLSDERTSHGIAVVSYGWRWFGGGGRLQHMEEDVNISFISRMTFMLACFQLVLFGLRYLYTRSAMVPDDVIEFAALLTTVVAHGSDLWQTGVATLSPLRWFRLSSTLTTLSVVSAMLLHIPCHSKAAANCSDSIRWGIFALAIVLHELAPWHEQRFILPVAMAAIAIFVARIAKLLHYMSDRGIDVNNKDGIFERRQTGPESRQERRYPDRIKCGRAGWVPRLAAGGFAMSTGAVIAASVMKDLSLNNFVGHGLPFSKTFPSSRVAFERPLQTHWAFLALPVTTLLRWPYMDANPPKKNTYRDSLEATSMHGNKNIKSTEAVEAAASEEAAVCHPRGYIQAVNLAALLGMLFVSSFVAWTFVRSASTAVTANREHGLRPTPRGWCVLTTMTDRRSSSCPQGTRWHAEGRVLQGPRWDRRTKIMTATSVVTNLSGLLAVGLMLHRSRGHDFVIGASAFFTSVLYHLAECLDISILGGNDGNWHRLDNIFACQCLCIPSMTLSEPGLSQNFVVTRRLAVFVLVLVLQEVAPWNVGAMLVPIVLCVVDAVRRCHINSGIWAHVDKPAFFGGLALIAVACACFTVGLEDQFDLYKTWHGAWHLFGGTGLFFVLLALPKRLDEDDGDG